ncbi:MAG: FMN-binding negative transcriptional regulator [Rhodospirillales bacterium]
MYNPPAFKVDDPQVLKAIMAAAPLATLVTQGPEGFKASHLPLLYLEAEGWLIGHLSRANDQWHDLEGQEGLAIFLGREGYVSPSWYASKQEHGKVVPTWNYEAVHATGRLSVLQEAGELRALVERLTGSQEAGRMTPWAVSDAPEGFIASQIKGIVGLRLEISRLEGKRKLSQNRPTADRQGVIQGLKGEAAPKSKALAEAMIEVEPAVSS